MHKVDIINNFINESFIKSNNVNQYSDFFKKLKYWYEINNYSYTISEIYRILLIIVINKNKDFVNFGEELNDKILNNILENILLWKSVFLVKNNGKIEISNKNVSNSIFWWNSINLSKILKLLLSKNILDLFKTPENKFYLKKINEELDKEKNNLNSGIWEILYELLKTFNEIDN
jgi:hypothetical protein